MSSNTALRVTELDFDTIRNNLKEFLRSQAEFVDYDFEGSGMAVLLDILAYNTHYMGYYVNMVGNEMFLDSAQLRSSVVSHAKHLGYVPNSPTSPKAIVNVKVTPGVADDSSSLTLPRFTRFYSEPVDGVNYIFSTTTANVSTKASGTFDFSNVTLAQGEPVTQRYTSTGGVSRFTIPTANVDIDTIVVTVQESSVNTSTKTYTLSDDITELTANTEAYFIEENSLADGSYTIQFGDGVFGKRPANGNIIIINYLETRGEAANKANSFVAIDTIGGFSNVQVTPLSAAVAGSPKESIEQIRFRAPHSYTAQNRAVTKSDYESLLLRDYPNIEAISVWSGDENDPPVYGKIFISMKPKENYAISLLEKERIIDEIIANRSVLTVLPEIVDPNYTYLLINAKINYNANRTSLSESELKQLVRQAIIDYRDRELGSFNSTFRVSTLQKYIDNAHASVLGSSVTVYAQKRKELILNSAKNYDIDFGMPLFRGGIENKFNVYPTITVEDLEGTQREVYIEDTPNSLTGLDSINILDTGSGYTTEPTVTITGDGTGATARARIVNGRISSIEVLTRGVDYTTATVTLTSSSGTGAVAQAILEARIGTLRSFYYRSNGEKVVVNSDLGTINYNNGQIVIILLDPLAVTTNDRYDTNYITFNAVPLNSLVTPARNRILDIDETDSASIVITMVPEV